MPKVKKIHAVGGNPILAAKLLGKTSRSVANILKNDALKGTYNNITKGNKGLENSQSGVNNVTDYTRKANFENIPPSNIEFKTSTPPYIENNDNSFYILFAFALKGLFRYILIVCGLIAKVIYYLINNVLFTLCETLWNFIDTHILDIFVLIIVFVIVFLIIMYYVAGANNRPSTNVFDDIVSGISINLIPNVTTYEHDILDDFKEDSTNLSFIEIIMRPLNNIGNVLTDTILKRFLRIFISNQRIDYINENDKRERILKKEGRCDNTTQIESKDGRYCYAQLDKKHIEFDNNVISYKLLEQKNMKNKGENNHFDYYIPNCKGSNIFTKEYIASCKDSRRTKFICKM